MTGKTDEEIIKESLNCSKMYIECVKEAIEKARASEREKVREETERLRKENKYYKEAYERNAALRISNEKWTEDADKAFILVQNFDKIRIENETLKKQIKEIFAELDTANDTSDCCGCSGISLDIEVYLPIKQKYLPSNTEVIE